MSGRPWMPLHHTRRAAGRRPPAPLGRSWFGGVPMRSWDASCGGSNGGSRPGRALRAIARAGDRRGLLALQAVRAALVALPWGGHVGERVQERGVVLVHAVRELVVGGQVGQLEVLREEVSVALGNGTDLDVDDIVTKTAAVGEAGKVAGKDTQSVGLGGRRHAQVQAQFVEEAGRIG